MCLTCATDHPSLQLPSLSPGPPWQSEGDQGPAEHVILNTVPFPHKIPRGVTHCATYYTACVHTVRTYICACVCMYIHMCTLNLVTVLIIMRNSESAIILCNNYIFGVGTGLIVFNLELLYDCSCHTVIVQLVINHTYVLLCAYMLHAYVCSIGSSVDLYSNREIHKHNINLTILPCLCSC